VLQETKIERRRKSRKTLSLVDAGLLTCPEEIAFRSTGIDRNQLENWERHWARAVAASTYSAPAFQEMLGATGALFTDACA